MSSRREAAIAGLYRTPGKTEIVNGEIVLMSAASNAHGYAVLEIAVSLREYARRTARGQALGDNVGFVVNLPKRWSFCPDAAFHVGPVVPRFVDGAPVFAVEVRSDKEYGPAAICFLQSNIDVVCRRS